MLIGFDKLNHAIVWDVPNQTQLIHLEDVNHAVWSPDSTLAAVYGIDGFMRVIDVQTGGTIHTFTQHYREDLNEYTDQLQLVWSSDSQKIALLDRGVMCIYQRSH